MCVCVCVGTPVCRKCCITECKQAGRHSGRAEWSFRTRSTGEDIVHGLTSILDAGQRVRRTLS